MRSSVLGLNSDGRMSIDLLHGRTHKFPRRNRISSPQQKGPYVFRSMRVMPLFKETFLFPAKSREQKLHKHTTFYFQELYCIYSTASIIVHRVKQSQLGVWEHFLCFMFLPHVAVFWQRCLLSMHVHMLQLQLQVHFS